MPRFLKNMIKRFRKTPKGSHRRSGWRRASRLRLEPVEQLEDRCLPSVNMLNSFLGLGNDGIAPPDTCGAAGPNSYVETVNSSVAILDKASGATIASDGLNDFLFTVGGITPVGQLADATMCYDEVTGQFIVGDMDVNFTTHVGALDLAVSKNSNPTALDAANWTFYQINTESGYDTDYPGNFGYNADAFVYTFQQFAPQGSGLTDHTLVTALKQSDLAAGGSVAYNQLDLSGSSIRPVTMHDSVAGGPMWFVQEGGNNASINLVRIDNILTAAAVTTFNIGVNAYNSINAPLNPDGSTITSQIDTRILKAAEANNTIVACQHIGVGSTEDDARWYEFNVSNINSPLLVDEGNVSGGNNTYITYPGIDINAVGDIAISYIQSGTDTSSDFMSVYVTGRTSSDAAGMMETPLLVQAGDSNNHDGREGDFSGINIDPNDGTFWAANEFSASGSWGTTIAHFTLGAANDLTASGQNVNANAGQLFNGTVATFSDPDLSGSYTATINWGDGNFSPGQITDNGNSTFSVSGSNTYAQPGSYVITVQISDSDGNSATANSSVTVALANDLTASGVNITATTGQTFNGTVAIITDPDQSTTGGTYQATIFWGDGQSSVATVNGNGSVSGSHIYAQSGSYAITVQVSDGTSEFGQAFSTATVAAANGDLTVGGVNITATAGQTFNGTVATITDPDQSTTGGTYQATVLWGDGQSSVATVNGNGSVSGSHVYAQSGSYAITVQVTDGASESGQAFSTATVAAANGSGQGIAGFQSSSGQWFVGVSNGSSFNTTVWGSWNPNLTWGVVVTGDFNGDGKTDIAGLALQTGQWWVAISNGSSFSTSVWTTWYPGVTWVDVRVGDFIGDGKMDIAGRVLQTGQWWVAESNGSSFSNSLWTTWAPSVTWADVVVGNFSGHANGMADIAGRVLESGQWWVAESSGSSFSNSLWTTWSPGVTWTDIVVGNFSGHANGMVDIAGRVLESGQWWVAQSNGSWFVNSLWTQWSPSVTWVDVRVGDFNGDGKMDIVGRVLESGQWWVGESTGSSFRNSLWATWSPTVTWVDVQVGDFNGDGLADITGRDAQGGNWWTGLSNSFGFATSFWGSWGPAISWTNVHEGNFV